MVQAHSYQLLNQKEAENEPEMTDHSDDSLKTAIRRLSAALDALEAKATQGATKPGLFERENASLRAEHEKLNTAISDLKERYGDLQQAAGAIYNKLEDSIKRLTQILEN